MHMSLCQPPMDGAEQALPAQARPVSQSGPLTSDYPACGVPQCLIAAAKPRVVVPGSLWEVHAGLAMEAFMCCHGPHEVAPSPPTSLALLFARSRAAASIVPPTPQKCFNSMRKPLYDKNVNQGPLPRAEGDAEGSRE